MDQEEKIRVAFERNAKALAMRPSLGQGTAITRVRLVGGLTCEIADGKWKLIADMGEKHGGDSLGPDPGVFGRAALGACLAMSYVHWAGHLGVPLQGLEVEVQADYDARGEYGVGDVPPSYSEVRYVVTVESEATEADILRMLDQAETHTPFLALYSKPHTLLREVNIVAPRS